MAGTSQATAAADPAICDLLLGIAQLVYAQQQTRCRIRGKADQYGVQDDLESRIPRTRTFIDQREDIQSHADGEQPQHPLVLADARFGVGKDFRRASGVLGGTPELPAERFIDTVPAGVAEQLDVVGGRGLHPEIDAVGHVGRLAPREDEAQAQAIDALQVQALARHVLQPGLDDMVVVVPEELEFADQLLLHTPPSFFSDTAAPLPLRTMMSRRRSCSASTSRPRSVRA